MQCVIERRDSGKAAKESDERKRGDINAKRKRRRSGSGSGREKEQREREKDVEELLEEIEVARTNVTVSEQKSLGYS